MQLTILSFKQLPNQEKPSAEAVAKSRGYLKMLLSQDIMTYAHFLTDVESVLAKMSLFLQGEKWVVSDVIRRLHTTVDVLQKYRTR